MVVEDNEANRLLVREAVREAGVGHLVEAESGERALELLARQSVDVVLMDCMMPGINGLDATRQLRSEGGSNAAVPVIALTAQASGGDRERCFEAGCDDYLAKPFDLDELIAKIDFWLARGRHRFVANRATTPFPHEGKSAAATATAAAAFHRDPLGAAEGPAPAAPPAQADPAAPPLLDRTRLMAVSRGDADFLRRYLGVWRRSAMAGADTIRALAVASPPALPAEMRPGVAPDEVETLEALRAAAHQLKGGSANAGVARLAASASELELRCRARLDQCAGPATTKERPANTGGAGMLDPAITEAAMRLLDDLAPSIAAVDTFLAGLDPTST
jgi:CheY-like chemotaxis protein